jgi:hypothetical protein
MQLLEDEEQIMRGDKKLAFMDETLLDEAKDSEKIKF